MQASGQKRGLVPFVRELTDQLLQGPFRLQICVGLGAFS